MKSRVHSEMQPASPPQATMQFKLTSWQSFSHSCAARIHIQFTAEIVRFLGKFYRISHVRGLNQNLQSLSLSAQFGFIAQNSGVAATAAIKNELLILVIFVELFFENIFNEAKNIKK